MPPCRHFARGSCRAGNSCRFDHDPTTEFHNPLVAPGEVLTTETSSSSKMNAPTMTTELCRYFQLGSCSRGSDCYYRHEQQPRIATPSVPAEILDTQQANKEFTDARSTIPCKFSASPGGCHKNPCPFLHPTSSGDIEKTTEHLAAFSIDAEDDHGDEVDDFCRDIGGATVQFGEHGHIDKILFPTDFSLARITGLTTASTPESLTDSMQKMGFEISPQCVRIVRAGGNVVAAMVKVEDPSFATRLSRQAHIQNADYKAAPIPISNRRADCKKIHVSWHRATRSVFLNFRKADIAERVSRKFKDGTYKCHGQGLEASYIPPQTTYGGRRYNPVAWTVLLHNVPTDMTAYGIERLITASYDKPRHVEVRDASYSASDSDVSTHVRLLLEEHGVVEDFRVTPTSGSSKRVKATAWFREDVEAKSACVLNNASLDMLNKGKLTVTLLHTAKIKVPNGVYNGWKATLDEQAKEWKQVFLSFHVYPAAVCTTLKVEGNDAKHVTEARNLFREIANGMVLTRGDQPIWNPALKTNGSAYQQLKSIADKLQVAIQRVKSKQQLLFFGPSSKFDSAVQCVLEMLQNEKTSAYEVGLKPHEFSWMIQGGYNTISTEIGSDTAVLDVVAKKIVISGSKQQYDRVMALISGKPGADNQNPGENVSRPTAACPICFCEVENPVTTSCEHMYCLECFEDYCRSAASTSKAEFQVECQGDGGACTTIFNLTELKSILTSTVFEVVLESSFDEYVLRHPQAFHYCPTPDCGYVYRCTDTNSKPPSYRCLNCLENFCTSCHVAHEQYTCAEYKDIASGSFKATQDLKKKLNIKDCPKCTTPMEKTQGCNHMTCAACKAHICWVCLAVFDEPKPCYAHMWDAHKSIGI